MKEHLRTVLVLIFLPWIFAALLLLVWCYREQIDIFFTTLVKNLFL